MKRITIGRAEDCDIVIPDSSDNVSRRHMVISFDLFGRMKISDISSNGTFINERRMLKGATIPVTREDKIRLGDSWILDWDSVKDPNRSLRILLIIVACMIVVGAIVFGVISYINRDREEKRQVIPVTVEIETETEWNKDSTEKVAPVSAGIEVGGKDAAKAAEKSNSTTPRKKKTGSGVYDNRGKKSLDKSKITDKPIIIEKEEIKIERVNSHNEKEDALPVM